MLNQEDVLKKSPIELYQAMDSLFTELPWLGFHPATLAAHYPSLEGTSVAMDKLLAVHAVANQPAIVCCEHNAFEKVCNLFNNNPIVTNASQPVFIEEVFYTVKQIRSIVSAVQDFDYTDIGVEMFYGEVPAYVAATAKQSDMYLLPPQLAFAQEMLSHLTNREISEEEAELVAAMSNVPLDSPINLDFLDSLNPSLNENDRVIARLMACFVYKPVA